LAVLEPSLEGLARHLLLLHSLLLDEEEDQELQEQEQEQEEEQGRGGEGAAPHSRSSSAPAPRRSSASSSSSCSSWRERARLLPELQGNILLPRRAQHWLQRAAAQLEQAVRRAGNGAGRDAALAGGEESNGGDEEKGAAASVLPVSPVAHLLDLRGLNPRERDALADVFARWRRSSWPATVPLPLPPAPPTAATDAAEADAAATVITAAPLWEARLRLLLGDRYDSRADVADCDYHLRARYGTRFVVGARVLPPSRAACRASVSSSSCAAFSLLCCDDYVYWRLTGIAHELRGRGAYAWLNPSLLSAVDEGGCGSESGSEVFEGDVCSGPFACLGGAPLGWMLRGSDEDGNRQDEERGDREAEGRAAQLMAEAAAAGEAPGRRARRSTVDAGELNALVLLRRVHGASKRGLELSAEEAHLALKVRGPTTEQDLAAAAAAAAAGEAAAEAEAEASAAAATTATEAPKTNHAQTSGGDLWWQERGLGDVRIALGMLPCSRDDEDCLRDRLAATLALMAPARGRAVARRAAACCFSSFSSFDVVAVGAGSEALRYRPHAPLPRLLMLFEEDSRRGSCTAADVTRGRERAAADAARVVEEAAAAGRLQAPAREEVEEGGKPSSSWSWDAVAPGQSAFYVTID
jgi:hypothetical protein